MSDQNSFLRWSLEGSTLRIGGQGFMENRQHACDYPWFACRDEITAAVIEPGILNLGRRAFQAYPHLAQVTLPEGLRELGDGCFARSALEEIALPDGIRCIRSSLFQGCMHLRKVTLPDSVEEIQYFAFEDCRDLTQITLSKNLKAIGTYAFMNAGLKTLDLPEGLLSIGELAFCGLPLQELVIPDSVENVEGRLNSRLSYPIRLPKGKEDMPVLDPSSPEQRMQHLAFKLFRSRSDVLLCPSGDPAADRYAALQHLLEFMESCYHERTQFLSLSHSYPGHVFFCCKEEYEITDNCYDGGCGPDYETTQLGVGFHILSEEGFLQRRSQARLMQRTPFQVWKLNANNNCLLDRPFGLRDRFLVDGDYPFALPEQTPELCEYDQKRQHAADALFGPQGDPFLVPKGTPREDRYAALSLLIETVPGCVLSSPDGHLDGFGQGNICYTVIVSSGSSDCYDGGCGGPDYESETVYIALVTPEELQRRKAAAETETDSDGVCVLGEDKWILEQPLGMKDSFLISAWNVESRDSKAFPQRFKARASKVSCLMCMGETFFRGFGELSVDLSGSLAWDHYCAMKMIAQYVDQSLSFGSTRLDITRESDYDPPTAQVTAGHLEYCFDLYEYPCYDGGCGGTDVERQFLRLRLVSDEELQKAKAAAPASLQQRRGLRSYLIEHYCSSISLPPPPAADSIFVDWTHLYLEHPYRDAYNLCIDVISR